MNEQSSGNLSEKVKRHCFPYLIFAYKKKKPGIFAILENETDNLKQQYSRANMLKDLLLSENINEIKINSPHTSIQSPYL